MARTPQRQIQARRFYEFAGYLADIHCGLPLSAQGKSTTTDYEYYRDTARERRIPCPAGGHLMLRSDLVRAQFGEMLKSLILPDNWREEIRRQMIVEAQNQGILLDSVEREKERLKLKRTRILKQHREGYIDDDEFHGEIAAVELALHQLQTPEVNGVKFDDVIAAGEHIPGMAALWDNATPEERREMVMLLLEPGGLYYDLELKIIAALKPRPAFLPILRMLKGVVEYDEAKGIIVTENWQDRNRRASDYPQETQRDRQTRDASSSSARLAIFLFCIVFQERIAQVAITPVEPGSASRAAGSPDRTVQPLGTCSVKAAWSMNTCR
jgi:site-specific DNA recombinase